MKTSKFLAVTLAALFPVWGCAETYSFRVALHNHPNPLMAEKIKLKPRENRQYAIQALDGCNEHCKFDDMGNCTDRLTTFYLTANCGDEKGGKLNQIGAQKSCAVGERLYASLKKPVDSPATVIVEIRITFDNESTTVSDIIGELQADLSPEFFREIGRQEEDRLRQLEEQLDAASRAAARSTAEHERAVDERKRAEAAVVQANIELRQADNELRQAEDKYNASRREVIRLVGELARGISEMISTPEQQSF